MFRLLHPFHTYKNATSLFHPTSYPPLHNHSRILHRYFPCHILQECICSRHHLPPATVRPVSAAMCVHAPRHATHLDAASIPHLLRADYPCSSHCEDLLPVQMLSLTLGRAPQAPAKGFKDFC